MPPNTHRAGVDRLPTAARSGSLPRRARRVVCLTACALAVAMAPAAAITVTVPDDWPTIQQAIDSGADEILVRPGTYFETPVISGLTGSDYFDDIVIRGLVPAGSPLDSLPEIAGLMFNTFDPTGVYTHSPSITISDLRFSRAVQNRFHTAPYSNPLEIIFSRCVLDSGLTDADATVGGQLEYYIRDCWIDALVHLSKPQRVQFERDRIRAPIVLGPWTLQSYSSFDFVTVNDNTFAGPVAGIDVTGAAINFDLLRNRFEGCRDAVRGSRGPGLSANGNTFVGPGRVAIECTNGEIWLDRNSIVGYEQGVVGHRTDLFSRDNRIEDCGVAIDVDGTYGASERDTILSCGVGARLSVMDRVEIRGAVVLGCREDGLRLQGIAEITSAVVGHCGGDGIWIAGQYAPDWSFAPIMLTSNTSYANAGSGYVVSVAGAIPAEARGNVGFGNGRHGIEVADGDSVVSACNDWFGNTGGDRKGLFQSTTDLTVDPLFCDIAQDDAHLSAGSPLLNAAGCGPIGALGQGCDAPVVSRLTTFSATSATDGTEVRWQVADAAPGFVAWLERAEAADGPWARVESERTSDGDVTVEYDRTVEPARSYWYRLVATDRGLTRVLGDAVGVETPPPTRFALLSTGQNPSPGTVEATFQLAHAAEITVEVFDAQGRRVATLAQGAWPAGIHRANWAGARPASGVYLVRYRHPGGEDLRRIAIVR